MLFFIGFQESFGIVEVFLWFPGVVSGGKSFPFDKEGVASSLLPVGDYGFNFILVFTVKLRFNLDNDRRKIFGVEIWIEWI